MLNRRYEVDTIAPSHSLGARWRFVRARARAANASAHSTGLWQDFLAFGQRSFDVEAWINAAIDDRVEADSVEVGAARRALLRPALHIARIPQSHISSLVMKLQLVLQDAHDSMQYSMQHVLGGTPR